MAYWFTLKSKAELTLLAIPGNFQEIVVHSFLNRRIRAQSTLSPLYITVVAIDNPLVVLDPLQNPGKISGIFCNVTLEDSVKAMLADAAAFFGGRIDLLFNNAGAGLSGSFTELTNEDWKAAFDLNFYGALYGIRHVVPYMKAQGGGQIVNTISGIAWSPMAPAIDVCGYQVGPQYARPDAAL